MSDPMKATLKVVWGMVLSALIILAGMFVISKITEPKSTTHLNMYEEPASDFMIYDGCRFEVIAHSYGESGYEAIYVDTRTEIVYVNRVTGGSGQSLSTVIYNERGEPMTREEFLLSEANNRHQDK